MRNEWIKKFDSDLYEFRSKVGSNIQQAIYFQKIENKFLITHGFTKKSQKTPKSEIEHAKNVKKLYEKVELLSSSFAKEFELESQRLEVAVALA